jgi:ubiquinol-cytochrome c reductase cytochrome c1 subunit
MRIARFALIGAVLAGIFHAVPARADDVAKQDWSFNGPFGTYDRASLQRGFQVYKEVCSVCHSMKYLYYRNLEDIGLSEAQVKAIAASVTVDGDLNDDGTKVLQRNGLPSDHFKSPFDNDTEARASNNGALPPDQSSLVNARDGGPDYIYAVLTGYVDAPKGFALQDGMNYNAAFSGNQIAMPKPLSDDQVTYADGTKATMEQEAHDVTTFLTWASNPEMEARKRMGLHVILFLLILTGVVYTVKRRVWANVH